MAERRSYGSYDDGCASAHALDLIGERWALIVVRELLLGPKRFADLQRDIPGIGPGALSRRLRELEQDGIVARRTLPSPAGVAVFELTGFGSRLEAVNAALSLWAVGSPRLPIEADMSPDTLVLAMRAHARPAPVTRRVALTLAGPGSTAGYLAVLGPDGTSVTRAPEPGGTDAQVVATTLAWKSVVIGGVEPEDAAVTVTGDASAVRALIDATRLTSPPGAGTPRATMAR